MNDSFFSSVYDRHVMGMDAFAFFWKVLLESQDTLDKYRRCSVLKGTNALWIASDKAADFIKHTIIAGNAAVDCSKHTE